MPVRLISEILAEPDGHHALHHLLLSCLSQDRKSTRLNSSHSSISYAVFCLKKKNHHLTERSSRRGSRISGNPRICRRDPPICRLDRHSRSLPWPPSVRPPDRSCGTRPPPRP